MNITAHLENDVIVFHVDADADADVGMLEASDWYAAAQTVLAHADADVRARYELAREKGLAPEPTAHVGSRPAIFLP
jgi:hypothetical protein